MTPTRNGARLRSPLLAADRFPSIAMPLGGIGTGTLAICADGGLRQWQLHNVGDHRGDLPGSFFALRVQHGEGTGRSMVLQSTPAEPEVLNRRHPGGVVPMVTDEVVPDWQRALIARHGGVRSSAMSAVYPIAELVQDAGCGIGVHVRALNPMVPADTQTSSIPVAMFEFTLTNTSASLAKVGLAGSLHNGVGLEAGSRPRGVGAPGYGGNLNTVETSGGWTRLLMDNPSLPSDHPAAGQMALACDGPSAVLPQCVEADEVFDFMARVPTGPDQHPPSGIPAEQATGAHRGASAPGQTWLGALVRWFVLEPGQSQTVRFAIAWSFPNRHVNFTQFGPRRPEWGATRFWLGNHYARRYPEARTVLDEVQTRWGELVQATQAWIDALGQMSLPPALHGATGLLHLAAQAVPVRSPTCFRDHQGAFFGFEGVNGASTEMWAGDVGFSCPLNCTHVWNYEMAVAGLFPQLERSMRETEFDVMQAPEGFLPHRVVVPTYLQQIWDADIGAPERPALDGMLGAILKTLRELRRGAVDVDWVRDRWSRLVALIDHVRRRWDPQGTGILRGEQPSTHDIGLHGANTYIGSLWLAALRAGAVLAEVVDDAEHARTWLELAEKGSQAYDELLFRGGYYVQEIDHEHGDTDDFGDGCLADQLIGQWWAHLLGLGHVLPTEHVREALRNIVRHNLTDQDEDSHDQRPYAVRGERGLLMCTWPHGGRPEVPTRYCDEVWTGSEYEVAACCLAEGLADEAAAILQAMWQRHDGRLRNPFNEVECGDHYARSMAGWSLLEAAGAPRWDQTTGTVTASLAGRWPLVTATGWGVLQVDDDGVRLEVRAGSIALRRAVWQGQNGKMSTKCSVRGEFGFAAWD